MGDARGGHPELGVVDQPSDEGLESNLEMWEEAERYLEYLCDHPDA